MDAVSVHLHLGEIGHGGVAVDAELGLDAEDDPSAVDHPLELRRPAVVDIARGVLGDLVVVDVLVHQDRGLEACFGRFGVAQGVTDHFIGCGGHVRFPLVVIERGT